MGYPLNMEGIVGAQVDPVEALPEDLDTSGDRQTDEAGVEAAPTLSNDALDAVDTMVSRRHAPADGTEPA